MELIGHRCTNCGAQLTQQNDTRWKCPYCGCTFDDTAAMQNTQSMKEMFDEAKRETVNNLRKSLFDAINADNISSTDVKRACVELKKYLPDDFKADFYEKAVGTDVRQLRSAIREIDVEEHYDDIEPIVKFLIKSLETEFLLELNDLIERAYKKNDIELYGKYATEISVQAQKVQSGVYETALPRDVFIAYSSKDMKYVSKLVEVLEGQGLSCFVAARNLRHGRGSVENYERSIKEAIDHCRSFVFVSTLNSRAFGCDALKIELPYVQKQDVDHAPAQYRNKYEAIPHEYKKPRVEYRVQDSKSVNAADNIVNEFFHGYEWVLSADAVAERVMKQLIEAPNTPKATAAKKLCIHCGAEVEASQKFCSACGKTEFAKDANDLIRIKNKQAEKERKHAEADAKKAAKSSYYAAGASVYQKKRRPVKKIITVILVILSLSGAVFGIVTAVGNGKVKDVEAMISDLPDTPEYYMDYYQEIVEAYGAYNELSQRLQDKVSNIDKLLACMDGLDIEAAYEMQQNLQFTESNGGYAVSVKEGMANQLRGVVVIPSSYRGLPVTTIPEAAFKNCSGITEIVFPDSITSIGYAPLEGCSGLQKFTTVGIATVKLGWFFGTNAYNGGTKVNQLDNNIYYIPSSLRTVTITGGNSIARCAFYNCSMLTEINLPETIKVVGDEAFNACTRIESINLPNIEKVSYYMLANCSSLKEFTIGDDVVEIAERAFLNCTSLEKINSDIAGTFIVPSHVRSLGYNMFGGCILLKDLTLPSINTYKFGWLFGTDTYNGGTKVNQLDNNIYCIPSSLRTVTITGGNSIARCAFYNCSMLTEINLPETIKIVGDEAFNACTRIESINLPNVEKVSYYMLANCSSLKEFTIGDAVVEIAERAFLNCTSLEKINSDIAGTFIVPSHVRSLGYNMFGGCILLKDLTLPSIGTYKFGWLFGTDAYNGGTKVNQMDNNIYYIPSSLRTVTITGGNSIARRAFYNCSMLTKIAIHSSISTTGDEAFTNCVTPEYY